MMLLGLVGKPSAGKSTFFKAATLAEVAIAPYPFTTIKPNHGVGYVKIDCLDKEFKTQCNPKHGFCIQHKRFVPVEIMDVAGLVPGASEGKGLGNQFLDELTKADVFIHVVDMSGTTDSEGKQTENYDPLKDIEFLDNELDRWFFNILLKAWKGFVKKTAVEKGDFVKSVAKQFSGLKVTEENVKEVFRISGLDSDIKRWVYEKVPEGKNDLFKFASALRRISKPTIIAANKIDMMNSGENFRKIKNKISNFLIVPCSADSELALREAAKMELINYIPGEEKFEIIGNLNEKQEQALEKIKENVMENFGSTGVQEVLNKAVFELLNCIAIFPASANKLGDSKGNILPDCFLLPKGSTALDFAFYLHTDFGKNFIKAIDARTKKALGKNYKLKNRDALEIIMK